MIFSELVHEILSSCNGNGTVEIAYERAVDLLREVFLEESVETDSERSERMFEDWLNAIDTIDAFNARDDAFIHRGAINVRCSYLFDTLGAMLTDHALNCVGRISKRVASLSPTKTRAVFDVVREHERKVGRPLRQDFSDAAFLVSHPVIGLADASDETIDACAMLLLHPSFEYTADIRRSNDVAALERECKVVLDRSRALDAWKTHGPAVVLRQMGHICVRDMIGGNLLSHWTDEGTHAACVSVVSSCSSCEERTRRKREETLRDVPPPDTYDYRTVENVKVLCDPIEGKEDEDGKNVDKSDVKKKSEVAAHHLKERIREASRRLQLDVWRILMLYRSDPTAV